MKAPLRACMLADAGVMALADDVYWNIRPQGSKPQCIVLHMFALAPEAAMDGPVNLTEALVQADCMAMATPEASGQQLADQMAQAVRALVHAKKLVIGSDQLTIFIESGRDNYDAATPAPDKIFTTSLDLRVWHSTL